jgi:hypothetical protein
VKNTSIFKGVVEFSFDQIDHSLLTPVELRRLS